MLALWAVVGLALEWLRIDQRLTRKEKIIKLQFKVKTLNCVFISQEYDS